MKPRFWTSLMLFVSAYAPLGVIVAAKDFDYTKFSFQHPWGCGVALTLAVLSVLLLWFVMQRLPGQHPVEVKTVKGRAGDLVNYAIPYLVTFVTVDEFFQAANLIAFGLFMALLFILTLKTQSLFINPVLAVMGYGLYDVEFREGKHTREGVLLCRGELSPGGTVRILRLSQFLFLATTKPEPESEQPQ